MVIERCAGLDIGKADVKACVLVPGCRGQRQQDIRTFATTTNALLELSEGITDPLFGAPRAAGVFSRTRATECSVRGQARYRGHDQRSWISRPDLSSCQSTPEPHRRILGGDRWHVDVVAAITGCRGSASLPFAPERREVER
jgi:hypothetical protein